MQIYELSVSVRAQWYAHSLSNTGSNGSNRLYPRRQMLANGTEVDAASGNILKHFHASLLAEQFESAGVQLCPACANRDGRRAGALPGEPYNRMPTMSEILTGCGMCDAHGFLVTGKRPGRGEDADQGRERLSKHSLIEFSFALALPDHQAETVQLTTRVGNGKEGGQMLMKQTSRSGAYAMNMRYKAAGIGLDTDLWVAHITTPAQRLLRHRAILRALRDQILSPGGALTSTMLPHLAGLTGAIVIRSDVGRAPMYSPLVEDFIEQLTAITGDSGQVFTFGNSGEFSEVMRNLIDNSTPALPIGATVA